MSKHLRVTAVFENTGFKHSTFFSESTPSLPFFTSPLLYALHSAEFSYKQCTRCCFNILVLLCLASLFSGCTSTVNMNPPITKETVITPEQGLLVVRVINATSYPAPFNYVTVSPENLNESEAVKQERLKSLSDSQDGTSVFASPLHAGRYSLSYLSAYHGNGNYYYSHFVPANTELGIFDIKAGEVTDLGSIVYYRQADEDRYIKKALRIPETANGDVLNKHFTFYQYKKTGLATWHEDDLDDDRETQYISALQNPTTHTKPFLAQNGSLYFLAPLGVIIERTVDGEWAMGGIDANFRFTKIVENNAGDIAIAGAEGAIYHKVSGGDWRDISLPEPVFIHQLIFANDNQLDVLTTTNKTLTIYRTNTSAHQHWGKLDTYTSSAGWASMPKVALTEEEAAKVKPSKPKSLGHVNYVAHDDHGILSLSHLSSSQSEVLSQGKVVKFAVSADWQFTAFNKTLHKDVETIIDVGNVQLMRTKPNFWSGSVDYIVKHENATEDYKINMKIFLCNGEFTSEATCMKGDASVPSKTKTFSFMDAPWFKNKLDAMALVTFRNIDFWSGKTSHETKIVVSNDGGKSWEITEYEVPKKYCSNLIGALKDRVLLSCNGISGDIFESIDMGKSWTHVRQHGGF